MANIGELSVKLRADLKNFTAGMKTGAKQASSFAKNVSASMRSAAKAVKDFVARAARDLAAFAKRWIRRAVIALGALAIASIKMAADVEESENLVRESFEGMTDSVIEWSERLQKELGLSAVEMRKQAGFLFLMTKSMGLTADQALSLSTTLTELSADMASFRNQRFEVMYEKIRSGIVGMSRPLKQIGINVQEDAIEMLLLKKNIDATAGSLSQTEKIMARYILLLEQTTKDQGDLQRTYNSLTNVVRVFVVNLKETVRELGEKMAPAVTEVAVRMRDWLIENRHDIVEWFGTVVDRFTAFVEFMRSDFQQGLSGSLQILTQVASAVGEAILEIFKETFIAIGTNAPRWILEALDRQLNKLTAFVESIGESLGDLIFEAVSGHKALDLGSAVERDATTLGQRLAVIFADLKKEIAAVNTETLKFGENAIKTEEKLAEAARKRKASLDKFAVSQAARAKKREEEIARMIAALKESVKETEKLNVAFADVGKTTKDVMTEASDSVKFAFVDMLEGMAVEMRNFGDFAKQFLVSILQEIAKMQARLVAARILGSQETGGLGFGNLIGDLLGWLAGPTKGKTTGATPKSRGGIIKPVYAANGFAPRGTDRVPAMLSPGEGVLSRGLTDAIREQLAVPGAGLGGESPRMTIQVQTIDSQTTAQWLSQNKRLIAGMLHEAYRGNHPQRRFISQIGR